MDEFAAVLCGKCKDRQLQLFTINSFIYESPTLLISKMMIIIDFRETIGKDALKLEPRQIYK